MKFGRIDVPVVGRDFWLGVCCAATLYVVGFLTVEVVLWWIR